MMKSPAILIALCCAAFAGCASLIAPDVASEPAALKAGQYAIDKDHQALLFRVSHSGYSQFIGRFDVFDAALDFDASDISTAHVEAKIDIASLDVANDEFARVLTGAGWFDAASHPYATFVSTSVERTGPSTGRAFGALTLRGVSAPVMLDVKFNGGANDILRGGYVVGFSAKGTISRRAFGIDKYDSFVGDSVEIEIEAEFVRT